MSNKNIEGDILTLIVFNRGLSRSFRNSIIKERSIIKNYGNGEFLGFAECVECIEGDWPEKLTIGLLHFDNFTDAWRWGYSDPILRQQDWLDQVDMFMMPLEVPWPERGAEVIHLGIKRKVCFEETLVNEYVPQAKCLTVDKGNALLYTSITDPEQIVRVRGRMGIQAIELSLWPNREAFDIFVNSEDYKTLKELREQSVIDDQIVATLQK